MPDRRMLLCKTWTGIERAIALQQGTRPLLRVGGITEKPFALGACACMHICNHLCTSATVCGLLG